MSKARELAELSRTVSDSADATAITINSSEEVTFADDIFLADGKKVVLGAGSDLQIYHDGGFSYIREVGTGDLRIAGASNVQIWNSDIDSQMANFANGGAATLYHSGSAKIATESGGVSITGSVTSDGLIVGTATGTSSPTPTIAYILTESSGSDWSASNPWGRLAFYSSDGSGGGAKNHVVLDATASNSVGASSSFSISTTSESSNTLTKRFNLTNDGDISFLDGSGNAGLFWDSSAAALGIGTSSPSSFDAAGDNLVVGTGSGNNGITVFSGTANAGSLFFADGTGSAAAKADGYIQYEHNNQALAFATGGGSEALRINSSGKLTYGGISYGVAVDPDGSGGFGSGYNFETNGGSPRHLVSGPVSGQYLSSGSAPFIAWYTATSSGAGTAAPERMRINSIGNVGIGCSPDFPLHVSSTGVVLGLNATSGAVSQRFNENGTARFFLSTLNGSNGLAFVNGDGVSERMRITSGGIALFGKAAIDNTTQGIQIDGPSGFMSVARDAGLALLLDRSNSGEIQRFTENGSTVGEIGTVSSDLYIGTGDTTLRFADGSDAILPTGTDSATRDGAIQLGHPSHRFSALYLSGGVYLGGTASNHKLDHVEYGNWTPTVSAGSGNESISITRARYNRIGNLVTVNVTFVAHGQNFQGTGGVRIQNLPFASSGSGQESHGAVMVNLVDFPNGYSQITAYKYSGQQYITFYFSGDSVGWAGFSGDDVTQNDTIQFTLTYGIVG